MENTTKKDLSQCEVVMHINTDTINKAIVVRIQMNGEYRWVRMYPALELQYTTQQWIDQAFTHLRQQFDLLLAKTTMDQPKPKSEVKNADQA